MSKLNNILHGFRKTIKKLDRLIEKNAKKMNHNTVEVTRIQHDSDYKRQERQHAAEIKRRLEALVGE
jgi:hypothetical protein